MKTVCFYAVATHLGGGERSVLDLVKGLQAKPELGYRPWVLLPRSKGPLVDQLVATGVDHDVLEIPESFYVMSRGAPLAAFQQGLRSIPDMSIYLAKLGILLRRKKPALIHTNAIKCHALAAVTAPILSVPVLWHFRDILPDGPTLWTLRALSRTSKVQVIANSRATALSFSAEPGIPIIHNGLNATQYRREPNRAFHDLMKIPHSTPLVGIVGVLARWKGQIEFLQMAQRMMRAGSPAHFVIVGGEIYDTSGERGYAHALREEAKRLGILDRVLFTGYHDDPPRAFNGLDVLVHASIRPEPFGRVVIEAMACGVPLAAAATGGVLETVEEGRTGLLFPPGDVTAMTEAVTKLVDDAQLRMRMSEEGRKEFISRFTQERHVEAISEIYRSLVKSDS